MQKSAKISACRSPQFFETSTTDEFRCAPCDGQGQEGREERRPHRGDLNSSSSNNKNMFLYSMV